MTARGSGAHTLSQFPVIGLCSTIRLEKVKNSNLKIELQLAPLFRGG